MPLKQAGLDWTSKGKAEFYMKNRFTASQTLRTGFRAEKARPIFPVV